MKLLRALIIAFSLSAASNANASECDLEAKTSSSQKSYDPFSPADTVLDVNVTVKNDGHGNCLARFYVAPVDGRLALSLDGERIPYRIEGPRGGDSGYPSEFGPFIANVMSNSSASLAIRFTLPSQNVVPKGMYTSDLVVHGVGLDGERIDVSSGSVILRAQVSGRVEMSISGTASPQLSQAGMAAIGMDFGQGRQGDTRRVFVNVWSNGSVSISLASQNQGVLKLVGNEHLPAIKYSARFDGSAVSLGGPYIVQRSPPLSLIGASYELAVTLGEVQNKFAGLYKDVVSINIDQN